MSASGAGGRMEGDDRPPRRIRIGRRNSTYQLLESLRWNRQNRHRSRTFLVEGVRPITLALQHGWPFQAVIYAAGAPLSPWAAGIVSKAGADRYELGTDLLDALSGKEDPSELLAVVRMPDGGLERIPARRDLLAVVFDRPGNPGNLGTLIRSCDAFGVHGVITTGHGADVYDPAAVTASRGSLFSVPVVQAGSHAAVMRWADSARAEVGSLQIVAADERGEADVAAHDLTAPTILVVGNETHGVSRAYREACDARVRIPITGSATSLNVAVAASIVLYEARRQRTGGLRPATTGLQP